MRSIMPSRSWLWRSLDGPQEVLVFPAGRKGQPGIRKPTPGRTVDGRAYASASYHGSGATTESV